VLSLAALPLLGVCALGVATVEALVAPGPLLYRQERVGRRGRRFMSYRFRTMQVAPSRGQPARSARRPDGRFLPGGWLLRVSGLDELPQILNVLRGEMSLVGPRPLAPREYAQLTWKQRMRCAAPPGMTGLWQVSDRAPDTLDAMLGVDLFYLEECSAGLDLDIIVRTIPAILRRVRGAGDVRRALRKSASAAQA